MILSFNIYVCDNEPMQAEEQKIITEGQPEKNSSLPTPEKVKEALERPRVKNLLTLAKLFDLSSSVFPDTIDISGLRLDDQLNSLRIIKREIVEVLNEQYTGSADYLPSRLEYIESQIVFVAKAIGKQEEDYLHKTRDFADKIGVGSNLSKAVMSAFEASETSKRKNAEHNDFQGVDKEILAEMRDYFASLFRSTSFLISFARLLAQQEEVTADVFFTSMGDVFINSIEGQLGVNTRQGLQRQIDEIEEKFSGKNPLKKVRKVFARELRKRQKHLSALIEQVAISPLPQNRIAEILSSDIFIKAVRVELSRMSNMKHEVAEIEKFKAMTELLQQPFNHDVLTNLVTRDKNAKVFIALQDFIFDLSSNLSEAAGGDFQFFKTKVNDLVTTLEKGLLIDKQPALGLLSNAIDTLSDLKDDTNFPKITKKINTLIDNIKKIIAELQPKDQEDTEVLLRRIALDTVTEQAQEEAGEDVSLADLLRQGDISDGELPEQENIATSSAS